MNTEHFVTLRCATCGCDDKFEFNDDKSYVKCVFCNREYFGGYDELVEMNQNLINEKIDYVRDELKKELISLINNKFRTSIKGSKYLKIK